MQFLAALVNAPPFYFLENRRRRRSMHTSVPFMLSALTHITTAGATPSG